MKTFNGFSENENYKFMKLLFTDLKRYKPDSSKKRSSEIYYYGKGFLQNNIGYYLLEF